jgi:alcohol dehydrogenase
MSDLSPATSGEVSLPFDYQPRTRLVFGPGALDHLGELARELSARRVLLVTDRGIVSAGHAERAIRSLEAAGLTVVLFDQVIENPTTRCVESCREVARAGGIDTLVGLGGGSSLDTAKGCNFLLTNGGRMQDYRGVGKARKPMLPLIAIPTTAGTGSECQSFALITDEATHQKMACGDPKAAACLAVLDPTLTVSQPGRVSACTGIDAIAHAVETAVTKRRNAVSWLYSREAVRLLVPAFARVIQDSTDLAARGHMLLGAAWAGTAIENSMLGAAHAAANPLTAHHGVAHGEAVGLMLPAVVRFNAGDPGVQNIYAELAISAGLAHPGGAPGAAVDALVKRLEELRALAGLPELLSKRGVSQASFPILAREAAAQWTAGFNPRPVAASDFERLYDAVRTGIVGALP